MIDTREITKDHRGSSSVEPIDILDKIHSNEDLSSVFARSQVDKLKKLGILHNVGLSKDTYGQIAAALKPVEHAGFRTTFPFPVLVALPISFQRLVEAANVSLNPVQEIDTDDIDNDWREKYDKKPPFQWLWMGFEEQDEAFSKQIIKVPKYKVWNNRDWPGSGARGANPKELLYFLINYGDLLHRDKGPLASGSLLTGREAEWYAFGIANRKWFDEEEYERIKQKSQGDIRYAMAALGMPSMFEGLASLAAVRRDREGPLEFSKYSIGKKKDSIRIEPEFCKTLSVGFPSPPGYIEPTESELWSTAG